MTPTVSPQQLVAAAQTARKQAYAPYSNYAVGAAVLTDNGEIILGCNVENASYGGTICAERVALTSAVAQGENGNSARSPLSRWTAARPAASAAR